MRTLIAIFLSGVTIALVYFLNYPIGPLPAIGRLLDPVNGCWANAEPVNENFSASQKMDGIQKLATTWIDDKMIPHIHASSDHDLYFMEGYLHARFRLWQMDMETRAAAGRVSEVVGVKALRFDRNQRRKGMGYAAENSLKAMEADPRTKLMMDAYTEGVNHYISTLNFRDYPLEYKLMGFAPEPYTNLKIALLLKYMADDLTGSSDDISLTYLRDALPQDQFKLLFPEKIDGSSPVIPAGTVFDQPSCTVPHAPADSISFPHYTKTDFEEKKEDGKGSNNWAISGARTASGAPVLCNDPHLGLNLPSLWYIAQLQAPGINVYGVSLPGTPGIVIGFNDSLGWGFTNNYRDVKDFYAIKPVDGDKNKYWFEGKQLEYTKRIERIAIKGKPDYDDTVNYTLHGPVEYDEHFHGPGGFKSPLAMCWMAHRGTNEMLAVYLMNKATNYKEFVDAILNFQCPAQNMAYADRAGNIAMWGQGQFVNKWKEQGRFIMDGTDSATLWHQLIPMRENPHVLNPSQGYVCSANQSVTDSTYPYWYNGDFVELRAWRINQLLKGMQKATIQDMFKMQQDTYSWLAANTLPIMLVLTTNPSGGQEYIDLLTSWDYHLDPDSKAATFYQLWWINLYWDWWQPTFKNFPVDLWPLPERTMQLIKKENEDTLVKDATLHTHLQKVVATGFKEAIDSFKKLEISGGTEWYKAKNTAIAHLTKLPAFSFDHIKIGGWGNTINAAKTDHGPSWRMVVQMGKEIEAYGIYPGGQSGNPGSAHYADFITDWAAGTYYRMQFLPNADQQNNNNIKYTWTVEP